MRDFGSFIDLNLTLQAPDDTARYFTLPHVLAAVDEMEARLVAHPDISHISSFTTSLKPRCGDAAANGEPIPVP